MLFHVFTESSLPAQKVRIHIISIAILIRNIEIYTLICQSPESQCESVKRIRATTNVPPPPNPPPPPLPLARRNFYLWPAETKSATPSSASLKDRAVQCLLCIEHELVEFFGIGDTVFLGEV